MRMLKPMQSVEELDQDRLEAMYKLLRLGPEPMNNLVRLTGWPDGQTEVAIDLLLASKRVRKVRRQGSAPIFQVQGERSGER